jgi:segregation and condensation protein B
VTITSLEAIIEGLLFCSDAPITLDRLCELLEEHERGEIVAAVGFLANRYVEEERGIALVEVAGGFQLRSRPELADYIRRLARSRIPKFSQSALESLAIIAYRQPITKAEIEQLRGVDSGGVLKTLMERKLIRIIGKKDIPGKPLIYGTSREFLEVFGLKDLAGLPTLKEMQELIEPDSDGQQELPLPFTPDEEPI